MTTTETGKTSVAQKRIVLSIDAMGGDHGPATVVAGVAMSAAKNSALHFLIHGPEDVLAPLVSKRPELSERVTICHATDVVTMDDKPSQVLRSGKNTSMWSMLESARSGDAAACVSCGNTGALMAMSIIRLRRIPGVVRPAIAVLWPARSASGFNIMLDVGADIRADAKDLLQYALMGVSYARNGLNLSVPRVALLNVGTEEHKGRTELKEAHELIEAQQKTAEFNFVGFVEGGDIPGDVADVIVTDGFTGNVALKTGEGTAKLVGDLLRDSYGHSIWSKFAGLLSLGVIKRLKKRVDPRRVNGGVFLGLNGTVVKSHGSADATGVAAAIRLAAQLAQSQFQDKIAARVASVVTLDQDDKNSGTETDA